MCVMDKVSLTKETSHALRECFNKIFLPLSPLSGNLFSVIFLSSERPKYSSVECVHHSWNTACTDWMTVSLLWEESFLTTCLLTFSEENVLFSALDSLLSSFFHERAVLLPSISQTEYPGFKFSELLSFFKSWLSSVSLFWYSLLPSLWSSVLIEGKSSWSESSKHSPTFPSLKTKQTQEQLS